MKSKLEFLQDSLEVIQYLPQELQAERHAQWSKLVAEEEAKSSLQQQASALAEELQATRRQRQGLEEILARIERMQS